MNKELTLPIEMNIKEKKKITTGCVTQAVVFSRFNIIKVETPAHECYYLLYYKKHFVFGEKLDSIEKGSFIDKARHEGIVLESNHPFLPLFIPNHHVTIPNKSKLFSLLQQSFTLQEVAYIASTLDSFFSKEQLTKLMDQIFFHYRRNGSFLKAFQIVCRINDFSPELSSAKDSLNSRDFSSYADFYNSSSMADIYKKDPLYVEWHCFKSRMNPENKSLLEKIFTEQDRTIEFLLLWMDGTPNVQHGDSLNQVTNLALKILPLEKWMETLTYLKINPFRELPQTKAIIEKMVREGQYEQAALSLMDFMDDLPDSYQDTLNTLWEQVDASFMVDHLDRFLLMMQKLVHKEDAHVIEHKLSQLVSKLLEIHDLKTVYELLQPIEKKVPHSLILRKISTMMALTKIPII